LFGPQRFDVFLRLGGSWKVLRAIRKLADVTRRYHKYALYLRLFGSVAAQKVPKQKASTPAVI
jgi:hypothetical protein